MTTVQDHMTLVKFVSPSPELTFKRDDAVNVVGFIDGGIWQPVSSSYDAEVNVPCCSSNSLFLLLQGLYCSKEMFDPSDEWFFGFTSNNFGWFPSKLGSLLLQQLAVLVITH